VIKGLHHAAFRCRDSEETRRFYEDFLGLPYVHAVVIEKTKTERVTQVLHTFYAMEDGSCLAFFEQPGEPFEFKDLRDYDLHIALEVARPVLEAMYQKGKDAGIETRGVIDHGFIWSVYFRDPNGYVVELATKQPDHDTHLDPAVNGAREKLADWQLRKSLRNSLSPDDALC
jgi:catechol 2,3-dioxygenase-like lactoylglutathione lyase family enzyme